jgi:hypothetical protein
MMDSRSKREREREISEGVVYIPRGLSESAGQVMKYSKQGHASSHTVNFLKFVILKNKNLETQKITFISLL